MDVVKQRLSLEQNLSGNEYQDFIQDWDPMLLKASNHMLPCEADRSHLCLLSDIN